MCPTASAIGSTAPCWSRHTRRFLPPHHNGRWTRCSPFAAPLMGRQPCFPHMPALLQSEAWWFYYPAHYVPIPVYTRWIGTLTVSRTTVFAYVCVVRCAQCCTNTEPALCTVVQASDRAEPLLPIWWHGQVPHITRLQEAHQDLDLAHLVRSDLR